MCIRDRTHTQQLTAAVNTSTSERNFSISCRGLSIGCVSVFQPPRSNWHRRLGSSWPPTANRNQRRVSLPGRVYALMPPTARPVHGRSPSLETVGRRDQNWIFATAVISARRIRRAAPPRWNDALRRVLPIKTSSSGVARKSDDAPDFFPEMTLRIEPQTGAKLSRD